MWVYEEQIELPKNSRHYDPSSPLSKGKQPLTKLINAFNENVKYLPGITFPKNLHANPSLEDTVKDATILVFNLPHQFINGICDKLRGHILPYARGVSCIKGVDVHEGVVSLYNESIGERLGIYCGSLSGANIATEVGKGLWSETTVAYDPPPLDSTPGNPDIPVKFSHKDSSGKVSNVELHALPATYPPIDHTVIKTLFHRPYFHVRCVHDVAGVSLGGALKNIVALAAGFVDGMGWGDNAKAAIMRVGLLEMVSFGTRFFSGSVHPGTFTEESCGVADLITSCSGGRNFRCAKLSVQRGVPVSEIERTELNGQILQGVGTAKEVNVLLRNNGLENEFPLFTAVCRKFFFAYMLCLRFANSGYRYPRRQGPC